MELMSKRFSSGEESTLSGLFIEGKFSHYAPPGSEREFICFLLEDQYQVLKVPEETRIPEGRYQIKLRTEGGMHSRYTDRFSFHRGMLWLQDVPDFEWIYIHTGNTDDHSEGCLLTGDGAMQNVTEDGRVVSSVAAYTRLYEKVVAAILGGEEVWITIADFA